jgi:hypothetical protein
MAWFQPGPDFGYTLRAVDEHPWNTLLTMKEVLKLEPGSLRFQGPNAEGHRLFWKESLPGLVESGGKPVFVLDTTGVHPHRVESEPRKPFQPWKS